MPGAAAHGSRRQHEPTTESVRLRGGSRPNGGGRVARREGAFVRGTRSGRGAPEPRVPPSRHAPRCPRFHGALARSRPDMSLVGRRGCGGSRAGGRAARGLRAPSGHWWGVPTPRRPPRRHATCQCHAMLTLAHARHVAGPARARARTLFAAASPHGLLPARAKSISSRSLHAAPVPSPAPRWPRMWLQLTWSFSGGRPWKAANGAARVYGACGEAAGARAHAHAPGRRLRQGVHGLEPRARPGFGGERLRGCVVGLRRPVPGGCRI